MGAKVQEEMDKGTPMKKIHLNELVKQVAGPAFGCMVTSSEELSEFDDSRGLAHTGAQLELG